LLEAWILWIISVNVNFRHDSHRQVRLKHANLMLSHVNVKKNTEENNRFAENMKIYWPFSETTTGQQSCPRIVRKPVINLAYYLHLISFIKKMCNPDLICPNIILKVSNMLSKHVHIFYMTILIIIFALRYSQFYGNANWNEHYI
jgi:hypothetical protein